MERPKLIQVHQKVQTVFNDYKSRQLDILGNFVNTLNQKSDEHQLNLQRMYNTVRLNRNMANSRLKKKYPDGPPQGEIDAMEDKYKSAYLSLVVKENQDFSEWLYQYQTDNLIKSRDSLNKIITEMQNPPKRRKARRVVYEPNVPAGSFQDVPEELGPHDLPPLPTANPAPVNDDGLNNLFAADDIDMDSFATAPGQKRNRGLSFDEFVEGYEMFDKEYRDNYIPPSN